MRMNVGKHWKLIVLGTKFLLEKQIFCSPTSLLFMRDNYLYFSLRTLGLLSLSVSSLNFSLFHLCIVMWRHPHLSDWEFNDLASKYRNRSEWRLNLSPFMMFKYTSDRSSSMTEWIESQIIMEIISNSIELGLISIALSHSQLNSVNNASKQTNHSKKFHNTEAFDHVFLSHIWHPIKSSAKNAQHIT